MKHKLSWLLALLAVATPSLAHAHEELVDQFPKAGETIAAGVHQIRLIFTDDLLLLDGGAGNEIVVTTPDGNALYAGCLPVFGPEGLLDIDVDIPGEYQVAWRVVSGDGHPISDGFSFFVENTTGYVSDPNFAYPDCASDVVISPPQQQPAALYWLLWASLGLVAAALFWFLRPKKRPDVGEGG